MLLSDAEILELIDKGVLVNADKNSVGPVSCDIHSKHFVSPDGKACDESSLLPGESVFVECKEGVQLPNDIAARVLLKNSRMREGLTLDAPLYFPGHKTVLFFRVTNVSANEVSLDTRKPIAQVAFERVEEPVKQPYNGTFQSEMSYSGMASYEGMYEGEIKEIEKKAEDLRGIEHRIYGNVLAIMAVLAGIFTLVNINAGFAGASLESVLTINLVTVGSFSALVSLISGVMGQWGKERSRVIVPAAIACACFVSAILIVA